ncbi:protein c2-domain aba-related 7 [Nicotiana attenuata]|uniref:Protein c2-domain aba-related 7 n=1 Tax=Nicotiana attenuata TaxID=49451 RepID=A0A1J6KSX5_NICAT|nr:protein c2-domain aba-related 7 [Nicotiana attenuata]
MLGLLKIRVQRGINPPLKDTFHSDPYVVVTMGEQRVKTSCRKKNCNPVWNDELFLALKYPNVPVLLKRKAKNKGVLWMQKE